MDEKNSVSQTKRPKALVFLLVFVAWSVFVVIQAISVGGTRMIYEHYNLLWLYSFFTPLLLAGGIVMIYTTWKRKRWGYLLGMVWLVMRSAENLISGLLAFSNKELSVEIMKMMADKRGRSEEYIQNISEFASSGTYDVVTLATVVALSLIPVFFMWKMYLHKEYF